MNIEKLTMKEKAASIRGWLRSEFPEYKFSVVVEKSIATIRIALMEATLDPTKENREYLNYSFFVVTCKQDVVTDEAKKIFNRILSELEKTYSPYFFKLSIGKPDMPFRIVNKSKLKPVKRPRVKREVFSSCDAKGTRFNNDGKNLYIDGRKVIKGYESSDGKYWFATALAGCKDVMINGSMQCSLMFTGYVQDENPGWKNFSKKVLESNKFKIWEIKKIDLPHAGRRAITSKA